MFNSYNYTREKIIPFVGLSLNWVISKWLCSLSPIKSSCLPSSRHKINIPFTVGGGIKTAEDVSVLLQNGADKISINTAAFQNPTIIAEFAKNFGSQCIVVAIDAGRIHNQWTVYTHGGKKATEKKLFSWSKEAQERGAGEILFTSMDHDGTRSGYAVDALSKLNTLLTIPVIASGGAGNMNHFLEAFSIGKADAALAASLFHYKELEIPELKKFLNARSIPVRLKI